MINSILMGHMKKHNILKTPMVVLAAVTLLAFGFSNPAMAGTVATTAETATMTVPDVCGVAIAAATDLGFGSAAQNDVIERLLAIENLGSATSDLVTIQGDVNGWQRVASPFTTHIAVGNTSFDDLQANNHVAFDGNPQAITDIAPGGADNNIDIEVDVQLINLPAGGNLQFVIDLEVGACLS